MTPTMTLEETLVWWRDDPIQRDVCAEDDATERARLLARLATDLADRAETAAYPDLGAAASWRAIARQAHAGDLDDAWVASTLRTLAATDGGVR